MAVAEAPPNVFDLYNEDVDADLPEWAYGVPVSGPQGEEVPYTPAYQAADHRQVRAMLVKLRQLEAEAAQVQAAKRELVAKYDADIAARQAKADSLRDSLRGLLEHGGLGSKLTYPDVGTIHLTTVGGNVTLANQEQAVSTYGFRFEHNVTDVAAMNAWARNHYAEHQELPKGYEVVPKRKALVVKGA